MKENGNNMSHQVSNIEQESGEPVKDNATFLPSGDGSLQEVELHMPELEDVGHPLVPEFNHDYAMREIGGVIDLELVSYVIQDPDFFAMLEGEAGTGKNTVIKVLCAAANWPLVRVNFGIGTTYESLVGRYAPADTEDVAEQALDRRDAIARTAKRISEQDGVGMEVALERATDLLPEGNSFVWVDGLLTKAVKNGWMFDADEINAAEDEAIMPLNGITEDRDSRYLTIEEKSEVIEPHPRFRFVATRNPIEYAGVGEMNSALESRAYIIEYDYLPHDAELAVLMDRTSIRENYSHETIEALVSLANDIRVQEQSGNDIMTKVSTRDLIKICNLAEIMDFEQAVKTVILGIADETDKQGLKEEINTHKFHT